MMETTAIAGDPLPHEGRLHGLDALRAAALLGGVVLHAAVAYILPGGAWAVGQPKPQPFLGWLVYYLHSFRLEVFFLLAGFFGALVVGRRGARAYARDRALRILLVFVAALYPMKLVLASIWITGGRRTGWLQLPPLIDGLPWYALAIGSVFTEPFPHIGLTHLWFLYVLSCIVAIFLGARAIVRRVVSRRDAFAGASRVLHTVVSSRAWPLVAALCVTPILATMRGIDVDTPDRTLAWHLPVMALYGVFFAFGWWLHGQRALLTVFAARWKTLLTIGVVTSAIAVTGVAVRLDGGDWAVAHATALRWATSFGTSLAMMASVFGWMGAFTTWFSRPSARARYVADASYFIYIAHLPIVVGLQVALSRSGAPWWVQVPAISAITTGLLLLVYHWGVRYTWIGTWLNGPRRRPAPDPATSRQ